MLKDINKDDGEWCDLLAQWIRELKIACEKDDDEACKELDRAKMHYEEELYAVYGGD